MTRTLVLVLSAFTSLIAVVTLVDGALIPSAPVGSRLWMIGVLLAGAACWLRWRWHRRSVVLSVALIIGAALLASFAALGIGDSVQVSSARDGGSTPRGIMDVLLGAQAVLMFYLVWRDRSGDPAAGQSTRPGGTDAP